MQWMANTFIVALMIRHYTVTNKMGQCGSALEDFLMSDDPHFVKPDVQQVPQVPKVPLVPKVPHVPEVPEPPGSTVQEGPSEMPASLQPAQEAPVTVAEAPNEEPPEVPVEEPVPAAAPVQEPAPENDDSDVERSLDSILLESSIYEDYGLKLREPVMDLFSGPLRRALWNRDITK